MLAPLTIDDDLLAAGLDIVEQALADELSPTFGVAA